VIERLTGTSSTGAIPAADQTNGPAAAANKPE
jgi:hypothetical protein